MSDYEPIEVDWSDPVMEPGIKEATVKTVESRREGQPLRSSKGDLMLKVTFDLEPSGKLTDYIMLGGAGGPMGARKLIALGCVKGEDVIPADLVGRRVQLDCALEDYKGQQSLKAKKYIAIAGGDMPARPKDDQDSAPW